MNKEYNADMSIIGGGIAGLMVGKKLTDLGFRVALVEKADHLAGGQTTKNEGWLHRGAVHSSIVPDRQKAIQVAQRVIYGHEFIKTYAPEAIEDPLLPVYALIKDISITNEVLSRWDEAGMKYQPVTRSAFTDQVPEVNINRILDIFYAGDLVVNTRILSQKLIADIERKGSYIFTQAELVPQSDGRGTITFANGEIVTISSSLFINTTGAGMKAFYENYLEQPFPMRFWKSHLVIVPRLTKNSIFHIDGNESTIHNHDKYSVCGQNLEAEQVENPDSTILPLRSQSVFEAAVRLVPAAQQYQFAQQIVACVKPDLPTTHGDVRSVDVTIVEPTPNIIFALPGKMTESPYVADEIIRRVFDRVVDKRIAKRPLDALDGKQTINETN